MGHNLGMRHDCMLNGRYLCSHRSKPRREDGKDCYGYMDYDAQTNHWSHCNVNDLTKTNKNCLPTLGDDDVDDGNPHINTVYSV